VLKSCSSAEEAEIEASLAEEAEIEASLDGVWLAAEWVSEAIVESDCLSMIAALRQGSDSRRPGGALRELHAACNLLPDVRLEPVNREANGVAHDLAKRT
jgi:hypothetical protein